MKKKSKNKRNRGQAMVETSLVLPVLILLSAVLLMVGYLAYDYLFLFHVAQDAAHSAAMATSTAITKDAQAVVTARLTPLKLDKKVTTQVLIPTNLQKDPIMVRLRHNLPWKIPYLNFIGYTEVTAASFYAVAGTPIDGGTPTPIPTPSGSGTATPSPTPTKTPSPTPTKTPTPTPSPTPTKTPTPSPTPTPTPTPTPPLE